MTSHYEFGGERTSKCLTRGCVNAFLLLKKTRETAIHCADGVRKLQHTVLLIHIMLFDLYKMIFRTRCPNSRHCIVDSNVRARLLGLVMGMFGMTRMAPFRDFLGPERKGASPNFQSLQANTRDIKNMM